MPLAMSCPRVVVRVLLLLLLLLVGACVSLGSVVNLGDDDFDDFVGKLPDDTLLLVDFFKVRQACLLLGMSPYKNHDRGFGWSDAMHLQNH